jgi:hypothetical protein
MIPTNRDSAKVVHPRMGSFNLPAPLILLGLIATGRTPDFRFLPVLILPFGNNRLNIPFPQLLAQRHTVESFIGDQFFRTFARTLPFARHPHRIDDRQRVGKFVLFGAGNFLRQRGSIPVGQQMDGRTLSFSSTADAGAPLFAGTNEPSSNAFDHSSRWAWSSCPSSANQMRSQVPSLSHWVKRRWAVESSPRSWGRSHQRHPVRRIYKIASIVRRSSDRGLPVVGCGGSRGWTTSHCVSLREEGY